MCGAVARLLHVCAATTPTLKLMHALAALSVARRRRDARGWLRPRRLEHQAAVLLAGDEVGVVVRRRAAAAVAAVGRSDCLPADGPSDDSPSSPLLADRIGLPAAAAAVYGPSDD